MSWCALYLHAGDRYTQFVSRMFKSKVITNSNNDKHILNSPHVPSRMYIPAFNMFYLYSRGTCFGCTKLTFPESGRICNTPYTYRNKALAE